MKTTLLIISTLILAACSSNNNSGSNGANPTVPVGPVSPTPTPSLPQAFTLENFSSNLTVNSPVSFQVAVNKNDGTVDTSSSAQVEVVFFTDNQCSNPAVVNGQSNAGYISTANSGVASYSSLYFKTAGDYYAKISSADSELCSPKFTIAAQNFDLHIKNLAMFNGTYGVTTLTFNQNSTELPAANISIFTDPNSDSYVSFYLDSSNIVSDDGTTRKYSFEFTDYGGHLQVDGTTAYVSVQSSEDTGNKSSDLTQVSVNAPWVLASESSNNNTLIMEVKSLASMPDQYTVITVFLESDFTAGGSSASPIFSFTDNATNPDNGIHYIIGNLTDMYKTYGPGTALHFVATTQTGRTVDLGKVIVGNY